VRPRIDLHCSEIASRVARTAWVVGEDVLENRLAVVAVAVAVAGVEAGDLVVAVVQVDRRRAEVVVRYVEEAPCSREVSVDHRTGGSSEVGMGPWMTVEGVVLGTSLEVVCSRLGKMEHRHMLVDTVGVAGPEADVNLVGSLVIAADKAGGAARDRNARNGS
jgi:hypothetical protein